MFSIIIANFGFWFNLLIPVAIALFLVFTNREYIWKEFGIQVGITLIYVSIIYALVFSTTTDLWDTNYYNGKVSSSTYYEEWKEEVTYTESYSCGTSKNPRTCTRTKKRIDYHSPYYRIKTDLGETISISRSDWLKTKREFGAKKVDIFRSNQVSWGDGDKFVITPTKLIPTAVGHSYENIVAVANKNVIHTKVPKEIVDQLVKSGKVREYPSLYKGVYGETLLNRIIDTTNGLYEAKNIEKMHNLASRVGKTKEANPILYITNEDSSITEAISQYWNKGKKNDVTLVLGVDDSGLIQWSRVICFTNNTDFIVDMENDFKGLNIDSNKIITKFEKNINNSFVRKPMKEFEYLKENITLEWYWQLLILLGNIGLSGYITYRFLNNWERKGR